MARRYDRYATARKRFGNQPGTIARSARELAIVAATGGGAIPAHYDGFRRVRSKGSPLSQIP